MKSVHNPALCLVREEAIKLVLKYHPEYKNLLKVATQEQIKKWEIECQNLEF